MTTDSVDINTFKWRNPDCMDFPPASHEHSIALFRDHVIGPSLTALDEQIEQLNGKDDAYSVFMGSDLADLFHASIEGYLLTTQSMFERGLRGMLIKVNNRLNSGIKVNDLERCSWLNDKSADLHDHFENLLSIKLSDFYSYADLNILQNFGSAIRHGDGAAARKLHTILPTLWINWLPPGESYQIGNFRVSIPLNAPKHPSFENITLQKAVLDQMAQSVIWFWEDTCWQWMRQNMSTILH